MSLELFGCLLDPPFLLKDPVDHLGVVVCNPKLLGCFMAAHVLALDKTYQIKSIFIGDDSILPSSLLFLDHFGFARHLSSSCRR